MTCDFHSQLSDLQAWFDRLEPELEMTIRDPQLQVEGYVVVWNTEIAASGPLGRCGKGGTRITPSVDLPTIRSLARTMALKNAAAGLPLGGAKSGLRTDPAATNHETIYRRFVQLCRPVLIENGGIFGGFGFDIGARPEHPYWACDELGSTRVFTGKPIELGGTDYDAEGITGLGVSAAARALVREVGDDVKGKTFAVQGAGAVGAAVIKFFCRMGGQLRYVADPLLGGTWRLPTPSPNSLIRSLSMRDWGTSVRLLNETSCERLSLDHIIGEPVDILFLCAIEDVISKRNQHLLAARYIVEGANNPCSDEARQILHRRGVMVVPDFIANSGGIIAAYVELTTKISVEENIRSKAIVKQAQNLTVTKVTSNVATMMRTSKEFSASTIDAANYISLRHILHRSLKV